MGYQPAGDQMEIGRRLRGNITSRKRGYDKLFHLPPMSDKNNQSEIAAGAGAAGGFRAGRRGPGRGAGSFPAGRRGPGRGAGGFPAGRADLAAARARLEAAGHGRTYWRSLDDLAQSPQFRDLVEREFPRLAIGWSEDESPVEGRRNS